MCRGAIMDKSAHRSGLTVFDEHANVDKVVMTGRDLCDDVLATLHKLKAAVAQTSRKVGRRWKQHRPKNGVELLELVPGGAQDDLDDPDLAHAMVASITLRCHVNEVLNVLVHRDSDVMNSTAQSLGWSKTAEGTRLFHQRRSLRRSLNSESGSESHPHPALVSVETMTIRPKSAMKKQSKQRLGFSTCTIRSPDGDRAYHLMKTLPKFIHNQVVKGSENTALQGKLDHIAIGWDIQSLNVGAYGGMNQMTRIIVYAYISTVPPSEYGRLHPASFDSSALAHHRRAHSNPEAEHVVEVLAKSLRAFEAVIQRRRLGFQTFVAKPSNYEAFSRPNCSICRRKFSIFRRDHFCRLCGHVVCGECSDVIDVEVPIGSAQKKRCCGMCLRRVDACQFDDVDLVPALGPVVVEARDLGASTASYNSESTLSASLKPKNQSIKPKSRARCETLSTEANSTALLDLSEVSRPLTQSRTRGMIQSLDDHIESHWEDVKETYLPDSCRVFTSVRDHVLEFDSNKTSHPDIPLAPRMNMEKESRRHRKLRSIGILSPDYDRSALNMLAQVAANHLKCSMGVVSVIDEEHFYAVGSYQIPPSSAKLARDESFCSHIFYTEQPMVIKNPQRDMRFAQMPVVRDGRIKFYAGFPVRARDGSVLASLCVMDDQPRDHITTKEYATMELLSALATSLIEE
ncbi:hypothetical protein Poli38472_013634 [Pythium oligandrum]|uniref:FYVE-type domain-containing protein n=1 Tax=Pythium oligandrum TaxID=41045 RepID=A0A8K1FG20_PYTOL|nr:hypothetical protein Poli38472_013634 [Pythium oligandrum]|eukprot:TMW61171.1 hypothetical protein Poli38472_013634 [Pythium oligandrum]